jgi:hypothetical protein
LTRRNYSKYNTLYNQSSLSKTTNTFLSTAESKEIFTQQWKLKFNEQQNVWKAMHDGYTGSMSGRDKIPSHMDTKYVVKGLEVLVALVSDKDVNIANTNQIDILHTHVLILMSRFMLHSNREDLVHLSCSLVSGVSRAATSVRSLLTLGCVDSCIFRINHQYTEDKTGLVHIPGIIQCIDTITNVAIHVAGFHRATLRFDYVSQATAHMVEINYLKLMKDFNKEVSPERALAVLGAQTLINPLIQSLLTSQSIIQLRSILHCLLSISCGPCYGRVVEAIGRLSGKFIFRLAALLGDVESGLGPLSLALILQICRQQAGRSCLISSSISVALEPLVRGYPPQYENISYHYAIFVLVALCRCRDGMPYNPQSFHPLLVDIDVVKSLIIDDLARTIINEDSTNTSKATLLDMLRSHPSEINALQMSKVAVEVGIKSLIDYFTNPVDTDYYRRLAPQEFCIRAVIVNCLCSLSETAAMTATNSCIRYLCHAVYYSSYLFQGKPMSEEKAYLILMSVLHSTQALKTFCSAKYPSSDHMFLLYTVVSEVNVIESAAFFMKTLSTFHIGLNESAKLLQERCAVHSILFLNAYLKLFLSGNNIMFSLEPMTVVIDVSILVNNF